MNWSQRINDSIEEVCAVLAELAQYESYHHVIPAPRSGASEAILQRYERYLGRRLPPSYRAFLSMHDGYEWLAFPGHMLGLEEVIPGGEYWEDIREWKLGMADAGLAQSLDGIVIAYLDQPNNWAYLDPDRPDGAELAIALQVPGTEPDYYPDMAAFLHSCADRARLAMSWAQQRGERRG